MKNFITFCLALTVSLSAKIFAAEGWIRINQLGYLEKSIKAAVLITDDITQLKSFEVYDAKTNKPVWKGKQIKSFGKFGNFKNSFRLIFTDFEKNGTFYIKAHNIQSPSFPISNNVYNGTADFLLKYMRQQQCGYNPFLKDSCHTHDGFIVDNPELNLKHIDVKGGWHDATDYLQYVTTSANATYQMLFAYMQNPSAFKDEYDKDGNPGKNGVPDILDEAKWGLDWLDKMNPSDEIMFNQIADDRDHAGFRLPTVDSVNYGKGLERPVYFVTGKVQGLGKPKNRTTGVASTAGKYASAFSLGSVLLKDYYPEFAQKIADKAVAAYKFGKKYPGVCQTACFVSPYFYEEENYTDDLELAAVQLYNVTGDKQYLKDAVQYGCLEPVTPWMGADTASHYEWYPFINLGHFLLAKLDNPKVAGKFLPFMKKGLENVFQRGKDNPFLIGIPFIWCSNNLVSALISQSKLYSQLSKDTKYLEMEAALRDWLFGCNPWGTSMIIDLPENGDSPQDPHSSLWVKNHYKISGGLVDGPIYGSIFKYLEGLKIVNGDEYEKFQSDFAVYHDDYGDYSTNEPTMDGTASLSFYLSAMQVDGEKAEQMKNKQTSTQLPEKKNN
ncbi:MAG: glycoside hydrolase family 9 protein [Bacteroidota bacterium]|nr:glycoside hydrolase family 9 protein [Bacteroidota bacterium]